MLFSLDYKLPVARPKALKIFISSFALDVINVCTWDQTFFVSDSRST